MLQPRRNAAHRTLPLRFRDPVTPKWIRARYVVEREIIVARYAEWEAIGPPKIRDVDPRAAYSVRGNGRDRRFAFAIRTNRAPRLPESARRAERGHR